MLAHLKWNWRKVKLADGVVFAFDHIATQAHVVALQAFGACCDFKSLWPDGVVQQITKIEHCGLNSVGAVQSKQRNTSNT